MWLHNADYIMLSIFSFFYVCYHHYCAIYSPVFNSHSLIPCRERLWGRFEDHFRVGDRFGVRTILGAVQYLTSKELSGINL